MMGRVPAYYTNYPKRGTVELEKEAHRRYRTAEALADDLRRFLKGESTKARPVRAGERLWRWCGRNRLVTGLLSLVGLLSVAAGFVGSYYAVEAEARREAIQERERADDKAAEAAKSEAEAQGAKREAERQRLRAEGLVYARQIALAQREWETGNVWLACNLLDSCRWDFRGWEYDYLYSLFNSNQRTFVGHTGIVSTVAFSPDGKRIVSGSMDGDGTVKVWDADTGQQTLSIKPEHGINSVAFSPDGKRIVGGGAYQIPKVWDAQTGQELLSLKGQREGINSVAFSPDDKFIVGGSSDFSMKVWDARTGDQTLSLKQSGQVTGVAFSPDGRRIVSGSGDQTVKVWDAQTGQPTLSVTLQGHTVRVLSVAFSPEGKRIVGGSGDTFFRNPGEVKVWDAQTG